MNEGDFFRDTCVCVYVCVLYVHINKILYHVVLYRIMLIIPHHYQVITFYYFFTRVSFLLN